jgi:tetratricopeptide (TPR) repeat protein
MKTIKHALLLLTAVIYNCTGLSIYAQNLRGQALADSLMSELPKVKSDTDHVKLLYSLARAFVSLNPDEAMRYADSTLLISQKISWTKGTGLAYINKARIYRYKSDYAAGLEFSRKSYETFNALNLKVQMADALLEMANNYERLGDYTRSIENNFTAMKIYEEFGAKPNLAAAYNNLGINYYRLDDYPKSIDNYQKALLLHKENNNKFGIASVLDNIASVYMEQKEYAKANDYNLLAISIFEEINDVAALGRIYFNRGNFLQKQKDFTAALLFYQKAMVINKKLNAKSSLAFSNGGIAELYFNLAKNEDEKYIIPDSFKISRPQLIQKAHNYFSEALKLSKETGELSLMMRYTESLSETEELRGNYSGALALYKESAGYKDSIFNDENKKKVAALENKRVAELKDKEIQLLNKDKALQASEIKRQTLIRNIVIGAVALFAIITFFFIRSYNRRRKTAFDKQVLETEMKALRAQMNPHFIFNSLHSINKYVIENDKENASAYLSKFSKLMRLVLENSREQEVPLESDLSALELYMQLESLRFQNKFQYVIEVDPQIDRENTLIPPLLLQPFAENSILHGIQNKEGGLIKINISAAENNMMRCTVEDNGTGREAPPAIEQEQKAGKKRKSLGMKIMEERLYIINQLKKVKAAINIFDLKDAENRPGGLRVELLLPMELVF